MVIDGDNISSIQFENFWKLNNLIYKQKIIYGDYSKSEMIKWQKFAIENNFEMFHCPRTNKKQTTDLNMFIDIMTKLFSNNYDELYLVTHDGDFVVLANSWIKNDKTVTFIGNDKTFSNIIKKNFNTLFFTKDLDIPPETVLLEILKENNEINIIDIKNKMLKTYPKIKNKKIYNLIKNSNYKYLWIIENDSIDKFLVLFYPKISQIKIKQNSKLKTIIKNINKIYPNFSKHITLNNINEL